MSEHAKTNTHLPSLHIEQKLNDTTHDNPPTFDWNIVNPNGIDYPKRLGTLDTDRVRFQSQRDVFAIHRAAENDFEQSYKNNDPHLIQRSLAWVDWLAFDTNLKLERNTYIDLAFIAARNGDATTVHQIIKDPRRLWLDKEKPLNTTEPQFGQLEAQTTEHIAEKLSRIAPLLTSAKNYTELEAAVMPVFEKVVAELMTRDLADNIGQLGGAVTHLEKLGSPKAQEVADKIVATMPIVPETLGELLYEPRFADKAQDVKERIDQTTSMARTFLEPYIQQDGYDRDKIDFKVDYENNLDMSANEPIAQAIVDHIPNGSEVSEMETSVSYLVLGPQKSVPTDILGCVRTLLDDPKFEFNNPQFGFAAELINGKESYPDGQITVVDARLPEGRIVVDLSSEPFSLSTEHNTTRFLCRLLQVEKNRRAESIQ